MWNQSKDTISSALPSFTRRSLGTEIETLLSRSPSSDFVVELNFVPSSSGSHCLFIHGLLAGSQTVVQKGAGVGGGGGGERGGGGGGGGGGATGVEVFPWSLRPPSLGTGRHFSGFPLLPSVFLSLSLCLSFIFFFVSFLSL